MNTIPSSLPGAGSAHNIPSFKFEGTDFFALQKNSSESKTNLIDQLATDPGPLSKKTLETALSIVANYPPAASSFFNWIGDKSKLKNTEFSLIVLGSDDPVLSMFKEQLPTVGDDFTIMINNKGNNNFIQTFLLYDRIFLDKEGKERPDGFARFLTALAHEFYGNIQTYIEKINDGTTSKPANAKTQAIKAYSATIDFLNRIIASKEYPRLPKNLQDGLQSALVREKEGLSSWQKAPK